jgi:hypothetical protein
VLLRRPITLLNWRLIVAGAFAFALGLTPFIYQPIRAAHFPALNEGEPTACTTQIGFDCTFDKLTWTRLKANIDREQYGKPSLTERQAPFTAQVGMWWLYFKWQWNRDAHSERPGLQNGLAVLFLALGLVGGWVHWKRGPPVVLVLRAPRLHGHVRADLLHELQVRRVAGAGLGRQRSTRGARPRLLLHLELLDLGRVGGARADLGLGVGGRAAGHGSRAHRARVRRPARASAAG